MTDHELNQLESLYAATTPGEWYVIPVPPPSREDHGHREIIRRKHKGADEMIAVSAKDCWVGGRGWIRKAEDLQFMATAHTAIPKLIAEIRRLRGMQK